MPGEGRVLLVHLVRTGGGNDLAHKVATPVAEPQPNEPSWPGKELVMVVAHQSALGRSGGGHYFSFFQVTSLVRPFLESGELAGELSQVK